MTTNHLYLHKLFLFNASFSCFFTQDCYLVSVLNELAGNTFMVFCGTCNNVQRVTLMLRNLGLQAVPLHGQMSQVKTKCVFYYQSAKTLSLREKLGLSLTLEKRVDLF